MPLIVLPILTILVSVAHSASPCRRYADLRHGLLSELKHNVKERLSRKLGKTFTNKDLYVSYSILAHSESDGEVTIVPTALQSYEGNGTDYVLFWTPFGKDTQIRPSSVGFFIDYLRYCKELTE